VEDASGTAGTRLALAEVQIPAVSAQRSLVLPSLPRGSRTPDVIALRAVRDARTGCADVGADVRCVAGRGRPSEEEVGMRRVVRLPSPATYLPTLTVLPRPGMALERLLERGQPFTATASTTAVDDVRGSVLAAVDDDPGTTWTATTSDLRPTISLGWLGRRPVSRLALSVDQDASVRRPDRVVLVWPGGRRTVDLDDDGRARFAPIHTDQLTLQVVSAEPASSLGFDRSVSPVPVGISELRLAGVPYFPVGLPVIPVHYACGTGPDIIVDGATHRTAVTVEPADLVAMRAVPVRMCDPGMFSLRAGENVVDVRSSEAFVPGALVLRSADAVTLPHTAAAALSVDGPVRERMRVDVGSEVLGVRQNANAGWRARQGSVSLTPATLDGWQQGFLLGRAQGTVNVDFAPDRAYRIGLGGGLMCLLLLAVLSLFVPRSRWAGRDLAPLASQDLAPWLLLGGGVLGAGLLAGWQGVLVAVASVVLAAVLRRGAPEASWWLLGGACLAASVGYVLRPWGSGSGWAGDLAWPHYLVLVPVIGTVVLSLPWAPQLPRSRRRMAGRSTRR
jgi:arabinofuranan 3-O-arabinosyltransferase